MSDEASKTIQVTCPCCSAVLTVDPSLSAVLEHKLPPRPVIVDDLKNAAQFVKDEATKRDERRARRQDRRHARRPPRPQRADRRAGSVDQGPWAMTHPSCPA